MMTQNINIHNDLYVCACMSTSMIYIIYTYYYYIILIIYIYYAYMFTAFCKKVVAIVIRLTTHLWTLTLHWHAKQIPSRRCHSSYTNEKWSLQPLHKTCSCRNNSTQSSTWDLDCIRMASSWRYLLSTPKWGQCSEVSRESNGNRDNHFANRCTSDSWILYMVISA